MTGRSLIASKTGIAQAKQALRRKNLTQTALTMLEKPLGSWATINKFFTGKPVDRNFFQEICHFLDLDWETIAQSFESSELETVGEIPEVQENAIACLYKTIQRNSTRTRTALNPYILPRLRRETLLEKCLKQIRIGIHEDKRRVIPILGAAGYGKSTILGTIYDELHQELVETETGWLALVRCDDLIESVENFALELGEKVSNTRQSIVEIAQQLTTSRGKGVLLIDTLDIILTKPLVPVLRGILSQLLEIGTTVVFTCRDADYSDFFQPYHESFAGFRESVIDGCKIPPFDSAEVRLAAREFVLLKQESTPTLNPDSFADKIIALSADSTSLKEIVCNPLLLALLCDLFAVSENVPEDLTVSQLYEKYWDWKIATIRHHWQSQNLGLTKQKLCLKIAETLYQTSGERLRDFVYESNLDLTETEFSAYTALKSDGVLKDLGGKRIGFFHQTFLEYAIARWLNSTLTGEIAFNELKNYILTTHQTESKYYIWPIFRQVLTLVTLAEFYQLTDSLDKTTIFPFRCITFAAISRRETEAARILLSLLEIAIAKDYAFQETLLSAANSAPRHQGETVWEIAVTLLEKVGVELVNRATEITAELLLRLENSGSWRFNRALEAIKNRSPGSENNSQESYHIWGKFIGYYSEKILQIPSHSIDTEILYSLKDNYFLFGSQIRATVIELYLTPGVPEKAQRELLMTIISQPPSDSFKEKVPAIELLYRLLPDLIASGNSPFGTSSFAALHAPLDKRWMEVSAGAVGRIAAGEPNLMETIIQHLFGECLTETSADFNRCNLMAVTEAIASGGGNIVATNLLKIPIETLKANRISTLSALFRELAAPVEAQYQLTPELKIALVEWITPIVDRYPVELIRAIDAIATQSPPIEKILGQLLTALLPELSAKTVAAILKKLKHVPVEIESYLQQTATSKESRSALLKLYRKQAENNNPSAIDQVINFCLDPSRDVALDASWVVLSLVEQKQPISVRELLPILANSAQIGVRQNALKALIEIINSRKVSAQEILKIFETSANDPSPEVVQLLYKLAEAYIWNHPSGKKTIEIEIAQAVFQLTQRLIQSNQTLLDMATKPAFITLNQIAILEEKQLIPAIIESTRALLQVADISGKLDKLVVTGLLTKLAKFDPEMLALIVREDLINSEKVMPTANQCALAIAIAHDEGKNSPLLDEILHHHRCEEEVKSCIIKKRGV